jgi:hypothetical protein
VRKRLLSQAVLEVYGHARRPQEPFRLAKPAEPGAVDHREVAVRGFTGEEDAAVRFGHGRSASQW